MKELNGGECTCWRLCKHRRSEEEGSILFERKPKYTRVKPAGMGDENMDDTVRTWTAVGQGQHAVNLRKSLQVAHAARKSQNSQSWSIWLTSLMKHL